MKKELINLKSTRYYIRYNYNGSKYYATVSDNDIYTLNEDIFIKSVCIGFENNDKAEKYVKRHINDIVSSVSEFMSKFENYYLPDLTLEEHLSNIEIVGIEFDTIGIETTTIPGKSIELCKTYVVAVNDFYYIYNKSLVLTESDAQKFYSMGEVKRAITMFLNNNSDMIRALTGKTVEEFKENNIKIIECENIF